MQKFSIVDAQGWFVSQPNWHANTNVKVKVQDGKTTLTNEADRPVYVVCAGTDSEFSKLNDNSGFKIGSLKDFYLHDTMINEASAQWVIIRYDENGERLGQLKVKANNSSQIHVDEATSKLLLTLRLGSKGTVKFEELEFKQLDLDSGSETKELTYLPRTKKQETHNSEIENVISRIKKDLAEVEHRAMNSIGSTGAKTAEVDLAAQTVQKATTAQRGKYSESFLKAMAASLPETNGSHHYKKIPATVGIITDIYMFNFYKDVFENCIYLSPNNYSDQFESHNFDAIFYVTCWQGINNSEWKGVKFRKAPMEALDDILDKAHELNIPTVFQSIEDPSNFEYFLPVAEKFDYVFTSDSNSIENYTEQLGHNKVFYGEYGANPLVNNPVGSYRFDLPMAFFAGSYPERYAERTADMKTIFDSIVDNSGELVILDRNHHIEGFDFPEKYQPYCLPPAQHEILQKMHKLFRINLNFNSIKHSPTMCAMRVYELQAQGKPIVSNYALSVLNKFPEIRIVPEVDALDDLFSIDTPHHALELANRSLLKIMKDKTSFAVVNEMARLIGLTPGQNRDSRIAVLCFGDELEAVSKIVASQIDVEAEVFAANSTSIEELQGYGYVAWMRAGIEYTETYLAARLSAFKYTDVELVSQEAYFDGQTFVGGHIHEFTEGASDLDRTMLSTDSRLLNAYLLRDPSALDTLCYQVDPYGIGYDSPRAVNELSTVSVEPKITTIIPIYNNGYFLKTKCIPSLINNETWDQMEVLLVDDGSTDSYTIKVCNILAQKYPNVRVISYSDGGSGSASRPRNRGIAEARGKYITFLDPDNEISSRGYDKLYESITKLAAEGNDVDFVSGYQVKVGEKLTYTGVHTREGLRVVDTPKEHYFHNGNFPVVSTQASLISTEYLRKNGIKFVERSAGQDTLFGWEVLANAQKAAFVDNVHLIYYAERFGSVTNTVDPLYFKKSLILEREQVPILDELGLLEFYKELKLDQFVKLWYLPKLDRVPDEYRNEAQTYLESILHLYGKNLSQYTDQ